MDVRTRSDEDAVDRSALLVRVLESRSHVVTVTAPAGYGKSRFSSMLVAELGGAVAADCAMMHDVSTTVRELLRALGPFEREFEQRQSRLVLGLPRDGSSVDGWRDLLDEALERAEGSRTLWIENGETLESRPAIAELVDRALWTGRRRAVVCSRVPLRLASIARTPPNDRYQIGTADLAFTESEITSLFEPLGIQITELSRVIRLAHGWPIAVLMFLRAAREGRLATALDGLDDGTGLEELGEYTLSQGLGSLSDRGREALAAAAILGSVTDADLALIADDPRDVAAEFDACPFVATSGEIRRVHPLAAAALTTLRPRGQAALVRAAERERDPVRAAQLFLAGGAMDRAADIIDRFVAPFMMEEPTPEIASLVASIDETILLRHPATWNATMINRCFTVPSERMLYESRIVRSALKDDAPIGLRLGVGCALLNWLFYLGHTDESEQVLAELDRALAAEPRENMMRQVVAMYHEFTNMRRGVPTAWPSMVVLFDATFGGIPMVATMGQYDLKGPYAFFQGDREETRRAFLRGVDVAATAHAESVYISAICSAAFYCWLAGDRDDFERTVSLLAAVSAPNVTQATRHFLGCATGANPARTPPGFELPVYRAYALLIAASRETELDEILIALRAGLDAAELDSSPWLRALMWTAIGLVDPARRAFAFDRARTIAEPIAYPAFRSAVAECTALRIPPAWIGLRVFLRTESEPRLAISLASREVTIGTRTISLAPREAELLLALALHDGPRDRATLAAMIWPDTDSAGSHANVYITRLRRRLGETDFIEAGIGGYRLRHPATVDLFVLEDAVQRKCATKPFESSLEVVVASRHIRLPQWLLASDWLVPYARRYETAIEAVRLARLRDAEDRGDERLAQHYRALLRAEAE